MTSYLSIGDFSRAIHMTVKTLRHYHEIGLLEPAEVDPQTGYRRYSVEQIPTAQVVRRFRDLGMPLEEVRTVLTASDVAARNRHISAHLSRLEQELGRTQRAVAALRDLLTPPASGDAPGIELRGVGAVRAAAEVTATVEVQDVGAWFQGALGELFATVAGQGLRETGHAGGVYADELFTLHRGQATVFVPCDGPVRPVGRVEPLLVPRVELAVIEHCGPPSEVPQQVLLGAAEVRLLGERGAQRAGGAGRGFDDIAAIATEVTGHPIARITASDDRFREQLAGQGVPAKTADQLLGIFAAGRAGEFATIDPTLASLLGRAPISVGTVLREQLSTQ